MGNEEEIKDNIEDNEGEEQINPDGNYYEEGNYEENEGDENDNYDNYNEEEGNNEENEQNNVENEGIGDENQGVVYLSTIQYNIKYYSDI